MEGDSQIHRGPRRLAIISDVHGDLVALRRVIADVEAAGQFDEVLLGGDLAQGGPQPAEVIDFVRERHWQSVRGNADELLIRLADGASLEEAFRPAKDSHEPLPESVVSRAVWSSTQLGVDRVEYLRALPTSIVRGPFEFGSLVVVHATPWSTEDVVLPDADDAVLGRMLREAKARVLLYGHIHTQYCRRVSHGAVASVGAVSGSNDADPRPGWAILTVGTTVTLEFRRVDWPEEERAVAYRAAGVENRYSQPAPGRFPVRSKPGVTIAVWP